MVWGYLVHFLEQTYYKIKKYSQKQHALQIISLID